MESSALHSFRSLDRQNFNPLNSMVSLPSRITRQGSRETNSFDPDEIQASRNTAIIPGIIRVAKSREPRSGKRNAPPPSPVPRALLITGDFCFSWRSQRRNGPVFALCVVAGNLEEALLSGGDGVQQVLQNGPFKRIK